MHELMDDDKIQGWEHTPMNTEESLERGCEMVAEATTGACLDKLLTAQNLKLGGNKLARTIRLTRYAAGLAAQ
jgi:hypothetical protein